jgi:hypothetical protein
MGGSVPEVLHRLPGTADQETARLARVVYRAGMVKHLRESKVCARCGPTDYEAVRGPAQRARSIYVIVDSSPA